MRAWRSDLVACGRAPTRRQALVAWLANPGFALACHYRLARWAAGGGRAGRMGARILERRMILRFACHLSASARIGPGVHFPHPLGIVIGEGAVVGRDVTIYHGVTLGRRRADVAEYPVVGDRATLFCGALLLGRVVVPADAWVGAATLSLGGETVAMQPQRGGQGRAGDRLPG